MYYILNENQARLIAIDFQHLVGKQFSELNEWPPIPIEKVFASKDMSDNWQVFLVSYTGDKDNVWQLLGHANVVTNIFLYLQENKMEADFDPNKYGLIPVEQN